MELNISLSLLLTALGMGTVMIVLYLINLMIRGLGKLFGEKPVKPLVVTPVAAEPNKPQSALETSSAASINQDELVAVISAAVAAFMGNDQPSSIYVKPYFVSPAWSSASKIENTQNL